MPLPEIINQALIDAALAYNAFYIPGAPVPPLVDRWIVTSANPCIFCRHMELLSIRVNVPPGGRFPVPSYHMMIYASIQDLLSIANPPAHDDCQCERVTLPTR